MKNFVKNIFNHINDKFGSIRTDLIIHVGVSALIFVLLFNILQLILVPGFAIVWATFLTLLIGVIKEYLIDDIFRDGCADINDLYADVTGVILGAIVTLPALF